MTEQPNQVQVAQEFQSRGEVFARRAGEMVISDQASLENASTGIAKGKEYLKQMEEKRKFFVKPLNDHVKNINDGFHEVAKPFEQGLLSLNIKRSEYIKLEQNRIENERREAVRLAQEKAEAEGKDATKAVEKIEKQAEKELKAASTVSTGISTSYMAKVWTWDVEDIKLVPWEFLTVDDAKVTKAVGEGVRKIAGIKVFQVDMQKDKKKK
jgi:hypothetical protein